MRYVYGKIEGFYYIIDTKFNSNVFMTDHIEQVVEINDHMNDLEQNPSFFAKRVKKAILQSY